MPGGATGGPPSSGSGGGSAPVATPELLAAALADPGRRVGRYALLRELGRGGMGIVYHGHDPELRRDVAIKMILDPGRAGPRQLERFVREARAAARLRHPGIVSVHEVGDHDGRPFIVMDYVEGATLERVQELGEMGPRRAAELVRDVARALAHAHGSGILHRDVKPQNVIVDRAGRAHLTDFGLARDLAGDAETLTVSGQLVGTPSYVAPEQARSGAGAALGPPADVYAAGGLLYFCLLGRPPFEGETLLSVLAKVLNDPPDPPRALDPSVHPDLECVALKCLEKDPELRYPSADELADDLDRFLDGRAIVARPLGARARLGRWARRHRGLAFAAVLGVLGLAAIAGAVVVREVASARAIRDALRDAESERDEADRERRRALGESERARLAEEAAVHESGKARAAEAEARAAAVENDRLLARALAGEARRLFDERRHGEAAALFARSLAIEETAAARSGVAESLLLAPRLVWSSRRRLFGWTLALSPDGRRLAAASHVGVRIVDLETGVVIGRVGARSRVASLAFGPRGRRLIVGQSDATVQVWDVETGEERWAFEGTEDGAALAVGVALGGERIVVGLSTGGVRLLDGRDGRPVAELDDARVSVGGIAVAPDGRRVAIARDEEVVIRDAESGEPVERFEVAGELVAWSADGARLAIGGAGVARVFEVASGDEVGQSRDDHGTVAHVAFDAAGRLIVREASGRVRALDAESREVVETLATSRGPKARAATIAASADGSVIVTGTPVLGLEVRDGASLEVRLRAAGDAVSPERARWSPAGDLIAVQLGRDRVRLVAAATGALERDLRVSGRIIDVAFEPSGARIAVVWGTGGVQDGVRIGKARVTVWDVATGEASTSIELGGHHGGQLAWTPDGTRLAVAGVGEALPRGRLPIRIYDVASGAELALIGGDGERLGAQLAWSPDGHLIAGASFGDDLGPAVHVWWAGPVKAGGARLGSRVASFPGAAPRGGLAFDVSGRHIASAGQRGLRVIGTFTGDEATVIGAPRREATAVSWHPTEAIVAASFVDGAVRFFHADGRPALSTLRLESPARDVAFSPDGRRVAIVEGDDVASEPGLVRVFELPSPIEVEGISAVGPVPEGADALRRAVGGVAWMPDGASIVAAPGDVALGRWRPGDGAELLRSPILRPSGSLQSIGVDASGKRAVIATTTNALVIDLATGRSGGRITPGDLGGQWLSGAAFLPDSPLVVLAERGDGAPGGVFVWDPKTGEHRPVAGVATGVAGAAVAADGRVFYVRDGEGLSVIERPDGAGRPRAAPRLLDPMSHAGARGALALDPDGRRIAIALRRSVVVVDGARATRAALLRHRDADARAVAFAPDGGLIATVTTAGEVRLWVARDQIRPLATLRVTPTPLLDLAWRPDGGMIATAGADGRIRVVDVARAGLLEPADALLARIRRELGLTVVGLEAVAVVPDRLKRAR